MGAVNYALVMVAAPDFMRAALLILSGNYYYRRADVRRFYGHFRRRFLLRAAVSACWKFMKDSHVGSNAVLAVIVLILLKVSAYLAIYPQLLTSALIAMSVATRTFMVNFYR